jgi:hypothetical protein
MTMKIDESTLPEGVYASFTYKCTSCGGTVTVVSGEEQPHECSAEVE